MRMTPIALVLGLLVSMAAAGGEPGGRPPGGRGPMGPHRPSDEPVAWEEVESFMKETSPNRYQAMLKLSARQQEEIKDRTRGMYRMIRWLKNDAPLWEAKKREIAIEDELFGLRMQLLQNGADVADQQEVRDAMRVKVRQLVDIRLEERAARIEKLRSFVAEEVERLTQDKQNIDELVDKRLKDEIETGTEFGRPPERPRWQKDGKDGRDGRDGKGRD